MAVRLTQDPTDARQHNWRVVMLVLWTLTALAYFGFRLTTLNEAAPVYSVIFFAAEVFIPISLALFVLDRKSVV